MRHLFDELHGFGHLPDELVRLDDHDRRLLREAGDVLLALADEMHRSDLAYLAGGLHGLSGRVPEIVIGSEN